MTTKSSSNKSESTPIFDISSNSLISLNMSNITKLTPNNFITWRLQISALLEAHDLHCFISDENQTPPETITTAADTNQPNPQFMVWKRQDRLLYSALLGSLSLSVQPIVARSTTSREIWQTLYHTYGKPSRGHIKQIKQQLKQSSKGNKSINDYMRSIIDQLALLGSPLDHEDLLDIITDGLSEDYRAIIDMVNGRDVPITIDELHEKLINRENTLKASSTNDFSVPVTANATQFRPQTPRYTSARGGFSATRGGFRLSRPYLGKCQICGVQGHGARRCPQYLHSSAPSSYAMQSSQHRAQRHISHHIYHFRLHSGHTKLITPQQLHQICLHGSLTVLHLNILQLISAISRSTHRTMVVTM